MNNKLIINTNLLRKESEFKTYTCVVEKAVPVPTEEFERLKHTPMCNNDLISENLNSTHIVIPISGSSVKSSD